MVSVLRFLVLALLLLAVYGADDEVGQGGTVSAQSSIDLSKSGAPHGTWHASTNNGPYVGGQAGFNAMSSYRPTDSYYNLYTYANYLQQYIAQLQSVIRQQIEAQKQSAASLAASQGSASGGVHGAVAGGYVGPNGGGYGSASLLPYPTNTQGGPIVPGPGYHPGGGNYHGVFSSASSSSSNVNGANKEEHTATFGVNNNGQITTYTVHNP